MNYSTQTLFYILGLLLSLSAFFSASETSLMSLNKYKLRHKATTNATAAFIQQLIKRPEKILAVILIGNNFVNIAASAIATIIGLRLLGDIGAIISTILLTVVILLFAEITPKTFASYKSYTIAKIVCRPIKILSYILYPLVLLSNFFSTLLLRIIGISTSTRTYDSLTSDELKSVVNDKGSLISPKHQEMLTSILDLELETIEDIMIPNLDITGININDSETDIIKELRSVQHTLLPVFADDLNNIRGILHIRDISRSLMSEQFNKQTLLNLVNEAYFVPKGTPLTTQLLNFQKNKQRIGLVVNEYGDIIGMITIADILEQIVGEFTTDIANLSNDIIEQKDGIYILDAGINIKSLNKRLKINIPSNNAKTLSGSIINYLEQIPKSNTCVLLNNYPIEILQIQDNMVKNCKLFPQLTSSVK